MAGSYRVARVIRSNETGIVEFDLMIRAWRLVRDVIRLFGRRYCYNDKLLYTLVYFKVLITKLGFEDLLYDVYFYSMRTASSVSESDGTK